VIELMKLRWVVHVARIREDMHKNFGRKSWREET
jgi:hypothetical protein